MFFIIRNTFIYINIESYISILKSRLYITILFNSKSCKNINLTSYNYYKDLISITSLEEDYIINNIINKIVFFNLANNKFEI